MGQGAIGRGWGSEGWGRVLALPVRCLFACTAVFDRGDLACGVENMCPLAPLRGASVFEYKLVGIQDRVGEGGSRGGDVFM